jgi:hypothetical protein
MHDNEPRADPRDDARTKLTAAILYLEVAREATTEPRARAVLDAALRAVWQAADLLRDGA